MAVQDRLHINFEEWMQKGNFNTLKLGMNKEEILKKFPEPEDWLDEKGLNSSRIWRYGNFEFHFDDRHRLTAISNDSIKNLKAGPNLQIEPWILNPIPNLIEMIQELNNLHWDYRKSSLPTGQILLYLPQSLFHLIFDHEDSDIDPEFNPNEFELHSVKMQALDAGPAARPIRAPAL